jgi:O-antigen/teichoic acid export membrane protein
MTIRKAVPRRGGMARNMVHLGVGQVTTTILTIVLNAVMARTLGPLDFGELYLVITIATFAYVVVDWGYGMLITRETARHSGRAGELMGSAFAVRSASVLMACVVAVSITWLLNYDVRTRVLAGALILGWLPQYFGLSFGWVFRACERMDLDALLNVVLKVATVAGSLAVLALTRNLLALMAVWTMAGCLTLTMGIALYRRQHLPALTVNRSTIRELVRSGAAFFAVNLAVALETYLNVNILYKMASPEVVGWLGAAANIFGTLIAPAGIFVGTMYPRLSVAAIDEAEFKRAFQVAFRPLLLLAVLGAVGTYLFADVAVGLIYGMKKFGPAADDLRAFAPALLLMYLGMFLSMAAVAKGNAGWLAIAKGASVALTTCLVFLLVHICQDRFGNGGLSVPLAMMMGESFMLVCGILLVRGSIAGGMILHVCRGLTAGAATIGVVRLVPNLTPFLAIPMSVVVFGVVSWLVGAVKRSDFESLLLSFRKRTPLTS